MTSNNDLILQFSQQLLISEHDIVTQLNTQTSWENRYRAIMLLGKQLNHFPTELQSDDNLVQGCESKVWLHTLWQHDQLVLAASSDAKIVKGLVAIVIAAFKGKTKQQILDFDVDAYFSQLNLLSHLSPSRVNGVNAIVTKIKHLAN